MSGRLFHRNSARNPFGFGLHGVDLNRQAAQVDTAAMAISRWTEAMTVGLRTICVGATPGGTQGVLIAGGMRVPCALGRSGVTREKREGDGATPAGVHRLVGVLYRPDRVRCPVTRLPVAAIRRDDGWCDDPADRRYNRPVDLPYRASHERLWREDHLYDVAVILDYNLASPVTGRGSAIFLHLAAPSLKPTSGCVAVELEPMRRLLAFADARTVLRVDRQASIGVEATGFDEFLLSLPDGIDFAGLGADRRNHVGDRHRDA
jgi:L,D-peptidoglycan transpeptidase YkuD (ErfK/YbiS/YcfS/YnhG family)